MRQQGRSSSFGSPFLSESKAPGNDISLLEHFRRHARTRSGLNRIFHVFLSGCLVFYPTLSTAEIVPDAGNTETTVTVTAPNNVPVVDIAAPSSRGVSHNQFETYNVDPQGAVLNNSLENGTSSLAGAVNANANFNHDSARIILNEVTSTNRSSLLGTTEVFGDNARLIVANPNGITCNGCAFIRTDPIGASTNLESVMLTTADGITLNHSGDPLSLSIDAASLGDIVIGPGGINLSSVDVSMLFTRQLQVQGLINAGSNNLEMLTGAGTLDTDASSLQSGTFTADTSPSSNPISLAIDASSVGAMNAGQIYIRATEDGVGVTLDNSLVSTNGDIEITAAGDIVYRNADASGSVNVAGAQITTTGANIAGQDIRWDMADGGSINTGAAATLTAGNDITFNCTGPSCDVTAQDNLILEADRLRGDSNIVTTAGHDLTVNAGVDRSGDLQSGQNLRVTTSGNVTSGDLTAANAVTVSANAVNSGAVQGTSVSVTTTGATATGNITSSGNTIINAASLSSGDIDSGQQLSITTTGGNIATGTLDSVGDMLLRTEGNGADLLTDGITSGGALTWQLTGSTRQRGNMSATGDISLECLTVNCSAYNSGALAISAANLLNAADISTAGNLTLNADVTTSGALQSGNDLAISARDGDITSTALLRASRDIRLTSVSGGELLLDGDINAGGDLHLLGNGHYLHDDVGDITVAGGIDIDIFSMTNDAILNAADLTNRVFRVNQLTNNGLIQSDSALTVQVDDILTNNGVITSLQGVVNINDSTGGNTGLINNNGIITAVNLTQNQSATSTLMIDTQPLIAAHIAAILDGELRSAQDLTDAINAANLEVVSQLTVDSGVLGALNIHADTFNNRVNGQISANEILLDGQTINNLGGLIAAAGNLSVTADNFSNSNSGDTFGVVTARHNIDINLNNQFNNQGIIEATDIAINAPVQNNSASSLLLTSLEGMDLATAGAIDGIGAQSWFQATPAAAYYYQYIQALDGDPLIVTNTTDLTDAFLAGAGANTGGVPIVGDDVFLAELVASTVRQRGGLPYVTADRNNVAQLRTLYDNTLAYMAQTGLGFGETPTAAQRQDMAQPILVFRQQTVGSDTVLVPTVLMPNAGVGNNQVLASQLSSRIEAHNDMLLEGEQITNGGNLLAGNNLIIEAVDLTQSADARNWYVDADGKVQYSSPMISATNVAVSLSGDYVQRGGQMVAGDSLSLQAKNIDVGAAQRPGWSWGSRIPLVKVFAKDPLFKLAAMRAGVADEPTITSGGDAYLEAEDQLNFRGKLDAGKSTTLLAGNLNLNSASVKSGGSIYMQADDIRLSNSRINGQDNTYLLAETGNIRSTNSSLNTTGDMIFSAEESITLKNSQLSAYKKADEGEDSDNSGGNLTLLANNGDILNEAGDIYAENSGYMKAGGDIINRSTQTVKNNATTHSSTRYLYTYKTDADYYNPSGFGAETRLRETTTESQRVETDVASIRVGEGGLVQIAGGDIKNLGGVVSSQGDIYQQAEGSIVNKTLTKTYLKQRTVATDRRAYGYVYNFYNPFSAYYNKVRQANADVTTEYGVAVQTAEIDAAGNLYQDAGGDIINQAGRLAAGKTLAQSAKGDIKNLSLDIASSTTTRRKPVSQPMRSNTGGCGLIGCGWQRWNQQNLYASNGTVTRNRYGVLIETTNESENQLLLAETSAGEDLIINAEGDYINRGNLSAGNDLQIYAKDIKNIRMTRSLTDGTRSVKSTFNGWFIRKGDMINAQVTGQQEVLNTGRMNAGGDLLMVASGDIIDTAGRYKAGGDIQMAADGDIKLNAIKWTEKEKMGGWIFTAENKKTHVVTGNLEAGGNAYIQSQGDLRIRGTDIQAGQNIALAGKQIDLEAVQKVDRQESHFGKTEIRQKTRHDVVELDAGGTIQMGAEGDLTTYGSRLNAGTGEEGGNLILNAGGDMRLLGVNDEDYYYYKKKSSGFFSSSTRIRESRNVKLAETELRSGGSVLVNIGNDGGLDSGKVVLEGTLIEADQDVMMYAGDSLNILSGIEYSYSRSEKHSSSFGGLSRSGSTHVENAKRLGHANINSGGDTILLSAGDINVVAGKIDAENIVADAGYGLDEEDGREASINIIGEQEALSTFDHEYHSGFSFRIDDNFFSIAEETHDRNWNTTETYIGSNLQARNSIMLRANTDINIIGSQLQANNSIVADAGRDLNILSGVSNVYDKHEHETSRIGIGLDTTDSSLELWAGVESKRTGEETNQVLSSGQYADGEDNAYLAGSSLLAGNIELEAGQDVTIAGSDLMTYQLAEDEDAAASDNSDTEDEEDSQFGNIKIKAGRDINTLASINTTGLSEYEERIRVGIRVQASENVSSAGDAVNTANDEGGLANGLRAIDAVQGARNGAVSASAGIFADYSRSESNSEDTTQRQTNISAGNDLIMIAGRDQNHAGTEASAVRDLYLEAERDVNIVSVEEISASDSVSRSASIEYGLGSKKAGISGSLGYSDSDNISTVQRNAHFTAGRKLTLKSGRDTNISGGVVQGDQLLARIGGDLHLQSRQDTSRERAQNINVSGSTSGSFSAAGGQTTGDRAWVTEQTGLLASGEMDVDVQGHTQLDGAVINSESGDLTFSTGTLAWTDIQDRDTYDTWQASVGMQISQSEAGNSNAGADSQGQSGQTKINNASYTAESHDKRQINRATIGSGAITVRDDPDNQLTGLNRDMALAQEITRDESDSIDLYYSSSSYDTVTDPDKLIDTLRPDLTVAEVSGSAITGLDSLDNALYDAFTLNTGENFNGKDRGFLNDSKVENVSKTVEAGIKAATSGLQMYQTATGEWRFVGSDSTYEQRLAAHLGGRDLSDTARENWDNTEGINNATDYDVDAVQQMVQLFTNAAGNEDVNALLYNNDTSGAAGNAQAFASEADSLLGINTDRTDISDPREFVEVMAHENRHFMTQGSGNGEEALATLYGRETAYQWVRSNTLEGRHTGGYSGRSMDEWRADNADSTLLANNNSRVSLVKTHNMDFRQFNYHEAKLLDKARVKIGQLPVSQETKDYLAFSLDAMACAEVRCAAQIPPEDPKYEAMKRMQDAGDALGEGKFAELMAKLGVETTYDVKVTGHARRNGSTRTVQGFEYGITDSMEDATQAKLGDEIEATQEYIQGGYEFGVYAIAETVALTGNEDAKGFANYMAGQVNTTWTDAEISSIGLTTGNSFQGDTWQPGQNIMGELALIGIDLVPVAKPVKAVIDVGDTLLKKGGKVARGMRNVDDADLLLSKGSCSGVFCNGKRVPDTGQEVDIELNYTRNKNYHDPEEYVDQAYDQGAGLSERKAGDAIDTIDDYAKNGRPEEAQSAINNYRDANPDVDMSGKDILHKTDICAGGDPSCISRAGDSGVNRSIGSQNGRQSDAIREQLKKVESSEMPTVRVNIENKAGD